MTEFKSLDMIVQQINHYIDQLNSGKLAATDIDALLHEVQQLQERLIILRYKAFEATAVIEEEPVKADPVIETPIAFSISATPTPPPVVADSSKQVSLMDVINEALQNTPDESKDLNSIIQQASGVSNAIPVSAPAPVVEVETPAPVIEAVVETAAVEVEIPSIVQQAAPVAQRSIYEDVALAEKLQKQAIGDLSKAIPLHQKFTFINELFHQNADDYHASIEQLNKFEEMEEAMIFVKENLMTLYKWNREDKNVESFIDLVERRFL